MPAPDPPSCSSFDPDSVDATLASSLDSLDDALNYRNWIVDLCAPHLVGPVLEVGAGHGTFTESYAEFGDVTAVEPGSHAASLLVDRYVDDARVTTIAGVVADVPVEPAFGSAVMINVLEHIEDDQGVLREIYDRLEPGGRLCIWVPSYEFLYSEFDAKLGHVRRYRKRQLEADVRLAGYEVVEGRHVNLPGWFSWLILVPVPPSGTDVADHREDLRHVDRAGRPLVRDPGAGAVRSVGVPGRPQAWLTEPVGNARSGPCQACDPRAGAPESEPLTRRRVGSDAEHGSDPVAPADLLAVVVGAAVVADADLVDAAAAAPRPSR